MITHLAARRYRCFRDWQQLTLGQLTLIYGENGAGKSALLRLLPWLAASSRQPLPTLDIRWPGLQGSSWREVCWSGRGNGAEVAERPGWWGEDPDDHEPDLAIGLRVDDWTLSWRLRRWDPPDWRWLDVLDARQGDGPVQTLQNGGSLPKRTRTHRFSWDGSDELMRFDGLIPHNVPGGPALGSIIDALENIRWLGPRRVGPDRSGVRHDIVPPPLDGDGAAAQALALADPGALERVSYWWQKHQSAAIGIMTRGEISHLVLQRQNQEDVPFLDAGEGLQQAFSVLVGAEQLRIRGGLLAVEKPEEGLSPRLQLALAEQLVDVARQPDAQVLLETHSEVMLLSALRAAVEHKVSVRLHWVEAAPGAGAQVREVELDADGRPRDTTLTDAFNIVSTQRRALIDARRSNQKE